MISLTHLVCGQERDYDRLRYRPQSRIDPRPIAVFHCTRRCNLACAHCYMNAVPGPDRDPDARECRQIIDRLAEYGAPVLLFSGGEPLARADLEELGAYARGKGLRTVISSNGTLVDAARARAINAAGFSYVGVSLDGLEDCHNAFRGQGEAFAAALIGIRHLKAAGVRVGVRFTWHRRNMDQIPGLFALLEREGIDRLCVYHLVPAGRGGKLRDWLPTADESRRFIRDLLERSLTAAHRWGLEVLTVDNHADAPFLLQWMEERGMEHRSAARELLEQNGGNASGERICAIDTDGSVYADQFLRAHPVGNILREPFAAFWGGAGRGLLQELRQRETRIHGRCADCRHFSLCRGNFRARAEALTGDLWASDPGCYLTDREIARVD